MKHRTWIALLLTMALMVGMAGCASTGSGEEQGGASKPAQSADGDASTNPEDVKIGILIPGSPTDGGFCQQAAEAGKQLEETYGYSVSVVEAATAETIRQEGENMAAEGYKIVFGHGGQCAAPLAEISPDYPDTWFVTTGGDVVTDNQFAACLCIEEATYVAGVVAAMISKTGVIGYSLGGDLPAYSKTTNAFELGAKSVNPDIKVLGAILSSPVASEGYETTMNQIQSGADVIYSNSNEGQAGAIKAVNESEGVYIVGHMGDFTSQSPDHLVLNALGNWPQGFFAVTEAIMNDTLGTPEIMYLTFENGAVDILWNDQVKATLPEEVIAAAEQTMADIQSGKIDVPNEYELG